MPAQRIRGKNRQKRRSKMRLQAGYPFQRKRSLGNVFVDPIQK